MVSVFVDADACPVREEAISVAARHGAAVVMVANGGIRPSREAHVSLVVVSEGPDAADQYIAQRIGPGDVCVTADTPLAARCLEAGGRAVKPNGEEFTGANIGMALGLRDLAADLRASDPFRTQRAGPTFSGADRARFRQTLDRLLRAAQRPARPAIPPAVPR